MQLIANIAVSTSLYLFLAVSFALIYFVTRIFHIAHGAVISCGAYLAFFLSHYWPLSLAIAVAVALAIALGTLCELCIYRSMRKKGLPPMAFLIASLGIYVVAQNMLSLCFGDDNMLISASRFDVTFPISGAYLTDVQAITIFLSLAMFVAVVLVLRLSKTGKSIRAVASNGDLCDIYGISQKRVILYAFAIGSAIAAVGGILSAMDTTKTPSFGFGLLLNGIVVMIIGGVGRARGLIVAAVMVATAQQLAAFYLDSGWIDAITFFLLIAFLLIRPLGISGIRLKKLEL